jgi:hypothetical protein
MKKAIKWYNVGPWLVVVLIILSAVLMNGCATQKRCFVKFPPDTVTKIEEVHVVEYRDTIVEFYIPGKTEVVEVPVDCPELNIEPLTVSVPFAHAAASVNNSSLSLQIWQRDTVVQHLVDSIRSTIDTVKITETVIVEKPADTKPSGWRTVAIAFIIIAVFQLGVIILIVVLK